MVEGSWHASAVFLRLRSLRLLCHHRLRWVRTGHGQSLGKDGGGAVDVEHEEADHDYSSMLNSSQVMDSWQEYFDHPTGSRLGLLNAIYQIGSIASFPFA